MSKELKQAIILNHMFTGDYLDKNIGHEIINLFADDFDRNFIYLCKDGKFNRNDIDIENSVVIQVYRPKNSKNLLEIISIAKGLTLIDEKIYNSKSGVYSATPPTYGGKTVYEIFKHNNMQQDCCVTFEAQQIFIPQNKVYIAHGDNITIPMRANNDVIVQISRNPSQQMREIIEETETSNFEALSKIIPQLFSDEKDALWQLRDPQNNKVDVTKKIEDTATDIYGIQSRELSYSNAIKYFIDKYPELLGKFCKFRNQCTINNIPEQTPNIYREWNNIDILIEWNEYVIVIENKIFSGINGKNGDSTQLKKYVRIVKSKKINNDENPFFNKQYIFILLTPNHNNLSNQVDDNWTIITYRELYEFLKSIISAYSNDFLFVDFMKSLEDHSKDDYMKRVMHKKFVKAISK